MLRVPSIGKINDNQLVPSPSQGSPPSPLELENWYIPDFDWLKEPDTPNTLSFPDSQSMESSFCSQRFHIEDFLAKGETALVANRGNSNVAHVRRLSTQNFTPAPPYGLNVNPGSLSPPHHLTEIKREHVDPYREHCVFRTMQDVKQEPNSQQVQNNQSCQLSLEKMEQLQSLAVEQASKDISAACGVLGIGSDPRTWSVEETRSWIGWILRQYDLPPIAQLDRVRLDGPAFCALTEDQLRRIAPHCGDILHAQLEIWKTAGDLQPHSSPPHTVSFKGDDTFLDLSAILNHWHSEQSQFLSISPNGLHGHPSHPPPFYPGTNAASSPSPRDGVSVVPEVSISAAGSDFNSEGIPSEDEASDDSSEMDTRVTTSSAPVALQSGVGVPTGRPGSHSHIHLWQFLKELLNQSHLYGSSIRWLDRGKGVFKIEDSVRVARLWGKRKNRPAMNYDKLSRSIRQYYKKGIMKKTERSQRLVYQFCHPYCL